MHAYIMNKMLYLANRLIVRQSSKTIKKYIDMPMAKLLIAVNHNEISLKRLVTISLVNRYVLGIQLFIVALVLCGYRFGHNAANGIISELKLSEYSLVRQLSSKSENLEDLKGRVHKLETELSRYRNSAEYKRYVVYDKSGVDVPVWVSKQDLIWMMEKADKYKIPYHIFFRIAYNESRFKKQQVSSAGAKGYFQVIPSSYRIFAKMINTKGKSETEINIELGAKILRYAYDRYDNGNDIQTWRKAIANYYGGDNVTEIMSQPGYQKYVNYVLNGYDRKR